MRNASRSMGALRSGTGELAKSLGIVAGAAGTVSMAMSSINKAMDFESELSTIQALTGMTGKQMTDMKNLALDAGQSTKYSALEAAQGRDAVR